MSKRCLFFGIESVALTSEIYTMIIGVEGGQDSPSMSVFLIRHKDFRLGVNIER